MNDTLESVILVDDNDSEIGVEGKMRAHEKGLLHRAFSIYILDTDGKWLLQKRARGKYHSGGLWSNACCGHPRPGETISAAAHRRLQEEMGFDCALREIPSMTYRAELPHGMIEHEFLHVFTGIHVDEPSPNPTEVERTTWMSTEEIEQGLESDPHRFSAWLKICFPHVLEASGNTLSTP